MQVINHHLLLLFFPTTVMIGSAGTVQISVSENLQMKLTELCFSGVVFCMRMNNKMTLRFSIHVSTKKTHPRHVWMYLVSALLSFRVRFQHTFCFQFSLMKPAVCLHLREFDRRKAQTGTFDICVFWIWGVELRLKEVRNTWYVK